MAFCAVSEFGYKYMRGSCSIFHLHLAQDIAQEYGISAMPTFILIKNSEKVDSLTGANIDKLREKITTHA